MAPTALPDLRTDRQNGGIHAITDRLARLGFVGFALDNYGKGVRGDETGNNTHLMTPLLADRALLRRLLAGLDAAADTRRSTPPHRRHRKRADG